MMSKVAASQRIWSGRASRLLEGSQNLNGGLLYVTNSNNSSSISRQAIHPFQPQQVRWKRKGGASAFSNPRPPTQKQRKKYNRWKKDLHWQKEGRHSKPGSQAADRRVYAKQEWDDLMMYDTPERQALIDKHAAKPSDYDHHDALLEDLMGNTAHLSSQPAPRPVYLGHKQEKYFQRVQNAMTSYFQCKEDQQLQIESGNINKREGGGGGGGEKEHKSGKTSVVADLALAERLLPTDRDISLALRAFRDKNGTRQKPIGIAKALQHLLKDLRLPTSLFGEDTFTTLLTCCRTPAEAQRIFKMQRDAQHPISAVSWSILVDVHAKLGDYEGCVQVVKDMAAEGVTPTMAAYTSLLAACYRVCADGRIPQVVRVQAYEVGWSKWKEMRIIGLDPDVMAYGAILRLCAVKGHPERAINLLEEMPIMDVKPTTLCFTSALRAVAKSQEIAVRYERGWSKKNKRREQITLHHGKMARSILILAENAEVKQDDGFIAALMLCAAAAGDSATAKAIYLASDVRKMDHLRTIGSDAHLKRLQGRKVPFDDYNQQPLLSDNERRGRMIMGSDTTIANELIGSGDVNTNLYVTGSVASSNASTSEVGQHRLAKGNELKSKDISILSTPKDNRAPYPSFGEREYGKDTRKLNALLSACAKALDTQNGLGTMWGGEDNKGFLCENSLRLINARQQPKYFDASIPNMDPVEVGLAAIDFDRVTDGIDNLSRRARKARLDNLDLDPNAALSLFDLDDETTKAVTGVDIKKEMEELKMREKEKELRISRRVKESAEKKAATGQEASIIQEADEMYFDQDAMAWKTRPRQRAGAEALQLQMKATAATSDSNIAMVSSRFDETIGKANAFVAPTSATDPEEPELELFVDEEDMTLKTRPVTGSNGKQNGSAVTTTSTAKAVGQTEEELYFDNDDMVWKSRPKAFLLTRFIEGNDFESKKDNLQTEQEQELYFDNDDMQWKSRPKQKQSAIAWVEITRKQAPRKEDASFMELLNEFEMDDKSKKVAKYLMSVENDLDDEDSEQVDLNVDQEYDLEKQSNSEENASQGSGFFLSKQSGQDKLDFGVNTDELDQFLDSLNSHQGRSKMKGSGTKLSELYNDFESPHDDDSETDSDDLQGFLDSLGLRNEKSAIESLGSKRSDGFTGPQMQPQKQRQTFPPAAEATAFIEDFEEIGQQSGYLQGDPSGGRTSLRRDEDTVSDAAFRETTEIGSYIRQPKNAIEALQMALPGLPLSRILKIREAFKGSLGDPSMLKLIPILRENMPEYVTPGWLKQLNLQNAHFAFRMAREEGLVDIHLLNGILEVEASAGRLDRTIQLYNEEFQKYNLAPTEYSDRLVMQMLIKNDRVPRALAFKEHLERAGRTVDIQGYGSLMDYYGRKEQLGSALLVLRECIAVHGAPPGEACLTRIRSLCRREDLEKQVGLKDMIGDDPLDWLREGETKLKREYSKKGNRDVNMPMNRLLHI